MSEYDLPSGLTELQRRACDTYLDHSYRWHDSYQRLPGVLTAGLKPPVFFACLGILWTCCDNVAQHREALRFHFAKASRRQLNLMMNDVELAEWKRLPSTVEAYRSAYQNNLAGYSYSMMREIAVRFSTYHRYRQAGNKKVFILRASIPKQLTILKLDREEFEIIVTRPEKANRLSLQALKPSEPA